MSKFDFFEEGIRRVFDNYELPLEENSWANFQVGLNAGKASNFLKVFALPGLLIAGLFGAMHLSTPKTELAQHNTTEHPTTINSGTEHATIKNRSSDLVISENDHYIQNEKVSDITIETIENSNEIGNGSDNNSSGDISMEISGSEGSASVSNTNSKNSGKSEVQENNSNIENIDSEDGLEIGPKKTKYEGSNYKLGAPEKFTPNNDNKDDTFIPPLLTKESNFWMRIFDRGGNIVFETKDVNDPWDGTVLNTNKLAEPGDYLWLVILDTDNKLEEYDGKVKLVR